MCFDKIENSSFPDIHTMDLSFDELEVLPGGQLLDMV